MNIIIKGYKYLNNLYKCKSVEGVNMGLIKDVELNNLIHEKHSLLREIDKLGENDEKNKEASQRLNNVNQKLEERQNIVKNDIYQKQKKDNLMEEQIKMVEEQKEVKKEPVKVRTDTLAATIEKVLLMKSIKTSEAALEKIKELKPNVEKKNALSLMKTIIRIVGKGSQKRWEKYRWDEQNFLLVEK